MNSFFTGFEKSAKKELIPGGKAEGHEPSEYPKDQIRKGIKVEMEHTDDPAIAKEIAMDHEQEFPRYYTALDKMEKSLKK